MNTPWSLSNDEMGAISVDDSKGSRQCWPLSEDAAALIVRAVNSHQALVDALADCVEALDFLENRTATRTNPPTLANARAALKLARGES